MIDGLRVAAVVFVTAIVQVSVVSGIDVVGGTPDLLLVVLVMVALLRGSIVGAVAGFTGGLIVDVATLGTLGVTSLLFCVAGYWAGRYGETTGRDRVHAPIVAVGAITLLVGVASFLLHFLLGEEISARYALVTVLLPTLGLNLIAGALAWPLCTRLLPPRPATRRLPEVELVA